MAAPHPTSKRAVGGHKVPILTPFAGIPTHAHPFYMSDFANPGDKLQYPNPGVGIIETAIWNDDLTTGRVPFYQEKTNIDIYIIEASLAVTPLPLQKTNRDSGVNTDLQIGLYKVPKKGPARYIRDATALFRTPYGKGEGYGPNQGGQVINAISTLQTAPMSYRHFGTETPLVLQITTPSEPDNYALGVVLTVNHGFGPIVFHYQFHIHGAHCQSGAPA